MSDTECWMASKASEESGVSFCPEFNRFKGSFTLPRLSSLEDIINIVAVAGVFGLQVARGYFRGRCCHNDLFPFVRTIFTKNSQFSVHLSRFTFPFKVKNTTISLSSKFAYIVIQFMFTKNT